ncbi:MAG TPA: radical SAM protein, partial [Candidatus Hydrogenedentes bacterium]|nr:radical SAM protein [Candidatus Hydrogenedentota bacterium]
MTHSRLSVCDSTFSSGPCQRNERHRGADPHVCPRIRAFPPPFPGRVVQVCSSHSERRGRYDADGHSASYASERTIVKAYIRTFGCQMNEHDSQRIAALLEASGYAMTEAIEEASLILLNTCSVRHNPENKVFSFLGMLAPLKRERPELVIGVGGCVAQQLGGAILARNRDVDLVFGPDQYANLPEMLDLVRRGERVVMTDWGPKQPPVQDFIPDALIEAGPVVNGKAYIAIMTGCNNFCSFCIVPYVRGREISRPPESILREARALIDKGAREIWLLGQNVNSYRAEGWRFYELLEAMARLPVARLRFTSPHPKDWDNALS